MGIYGCLWLFMGFWMSMGVDVGMGIVRMGICAYLQVFIGGYGYLQVFMGSWVSMVVYGYLYLNIKNIVYFLIQEPQKI